MASDHAVFPIHCYTGEIAHMLIGAGELVKQSGLSTVLISRQRKPNRLACTDLFLCFAAPIGHRFTHAGMRYRPPVGLLIFLRMGRVCVGKLHHGSIRLPQR